MKKLLFITILLLITKTYTMDIFDAIDKNDTQRVKKLLAQGINPNQTNTKGYTLLQQAAMRGLGLPQATMSNNEDIVKLLIQAGATIDQTDPLGWTPIHWASITGKKEIVKLLIDNGANIHTTDDSGLTPLHKSRLAEITQLLIQAGADVNKESESGKTPLDWITSNQEASQIAQLLINAGANIDKVDAQGNTYLHEYTQKGDSKIALLLILAGANPFIKNKQGKTALDIAEENSKLWPIRAINQSSKDIYQMLERYMPLFKEAQQNPTPNTLLKMANQGHPVLVKQLLKRLTLTQTDISFLGATAKANYTVSKNNNYKKIGQLLQNYAAGLRLDRSTTASNQTTPLVIAQTIAGYTAL